MARVAEWPWRPKHRLIMARWPGTHAGTSCTCGSGPPWHRPEEALPSRHRRRHRRESAPVGAEAFVRTSLY
eukprot:12913853-Prorocentrum_lima.AAC.1